MLHLIPDDDGLPHAPTSECGCDPQPARWRGQTVLVHLPEDAWPEEPGLSGRVEFPADSTFSFVRLREVMGRE